MSRRSILSLSLAAAIMPAAGGGTTPPPPSGPARHAFLVVGQSNAVGSARDTTSDTFPAGTYEFGAADTWVPPGSRLHHARSPKAGRPDPDADHGFARSFANRYMAENPGVELYLIGGAQNATSFRQGHWVAGGDTYEAAIARANAAMAAAPPGTVLKGILWHQGESDSTGTGDADAWQGHMVSMIGRMRGDVAAADASTPFVVGGHARRNGLYQPAVALAAQAMPNLVDRVGYASINSPAAAKNQPGDSLHYDTATQDQLGARMVDALPLAAANVRARTAVPTVGAPSFHGIPSGSGPHTVSAVPIGAPAADRIVVVGLTWRTPYPGLYAQGVTVGGRPAAPIGVEAADRNAMNAALWMARVPAGTSADVVVTREGGEDGNRSAIAVLPVTGVAPYLASREGWARTGNTDPVRVNAQAGDLMIGFSAGRGGAGSTLDWASPGEAWTEFDHLRAGGQIRLHLGWAIASAGGARDVTATTDAGRADRRNAVAVLRPGA